MADAAPHAPAPVSSEQLQITGPANGIPVIYRTEVQQPAPAPVSKDTNFNVTQGTVYLGFLLALMAVVGGAMKWLDSKLEKLGTRFGDELKR